jgi:hypothetical protein
MKTEPDALADTSMMRIVHTALRRDLARARVVLTGTPPPPTAQREALAAHLGWMMRFLRAHHQGEDAGLYPMVRARNPAAAVLLDAMDAEHDAIGPGIIALESAASDYGHGDSCGQRERLLTSIETLEEALLPHLAREEDEMMPVVSATITAADWQAWDQQYNIKPKSFLDLGREGHWLIDGLSPQDRQIVVGLVPPLPRFVLLHGFARSYRRHRTHCWGGPSAREPRVQKAGRVEVFVGADPDQVMAVVADVTRVGHWSHECRSAEWLAGATQAAPGARFRGRNRAGLLRWSRVCEITTAEPRKLVWRTVPTQLFPDSAEWTIQLHESGNGTRIEQTYRLLNIPTLLDRLYAMAIPAHRDRIDALTQDLHRLATLAANTQTATAQPPRTTITAAVPETP